MKTSILINSRGHAEGLIATCMYLANTCRHIDQVKFCIRADIDDIDTLVAIKRLSDRMSISMRLGTRPVSMGAEHNAMAKQNPADVYLILNDSLFPCPVIKTVPDDSGRVDISMGYWDLYLNAVLEDDSPEKPKVGIYCWHLTDGKTGDYPIITGKWYDAADRIFPEYFPFWFDDQWLMALHCYVYGKSFARIESLLIHAPKQFVSRMRNNNVWVEFYQAMESERLAEASRIRASLGLDPEVPQQFIELVRGYETRFHAEFGEKEQRLGDKREPDPSYLQALDRAISILESKKANGERTWYEGFAELQPVQPQRAAE